ncbi:MAG: cysteine--tRNA ligase [Patescibacteria group bacterium]
MIKLYNTLSRQKEAFKPIRKKMVGLYTCGPTVYNYAHIGNLRTYIFEDILKRVLLYNGYRVKHVMNITDVGHLVSDADTGEDKIEKAAQEAGQTPQEIANFYTQVFRRNLKDLNIIEPNIWCKATGHIKEQIDLIKKLERKGFTYKIDDGIYFDTSKLKDYGKLAKLDLVGLRAGARIEVVAGKKNPTDFALWKFSPKDKKRLQEWPSPWGIGFPGWHIECAAMSIKYLGIPFDIHCGGIDHIPIHHTNEIAEAEAAYDKKFVNYWLHGEFLLLDKEKMAKSAGEFITLEKLTDKGFNPLAYRYLCLITHYRSQLNFFWDALEAAQNALNNLYQTISTFKAPYKNAPEYEQKFLEAINDDLDIPRALAITWDLVKSNLPNSTKIASLFKFDKVLGLKLREFWESARKIPKNVLRLIEQREVARKKQDFQKADQLRKKIKEKGYLIEDTANGPVIKKIIL